MATAQSGTTDPDPQNPGIRPSTPGGSSGPILPIPDPIFPPQVKGIWQFNRSLSDDVGTNDFAPSSGGVSYAQFNRYELIPNRNITRSGLVFEQDKSYSAINSYAYPDDFTMAFWWYSPGLLGFTKHATTRELESKVAPVIAIGDAGAPASQTVLSNATMALTEVGYDKNRNAIRAYLSADGINVSHIITSEPYTPGLRHILVTYIKDQGRFRIDIDGETGILHSAPTTSLQKTGRIRINDVAPGYISHTTTQVGGYLFDLVFTTFAATDNQSLKAFRYGYEHICYESLFDARFAYFGLAYSQPSTVSTSHIWVDGGNIFAARSNGKLVKGARPVWDKEFSYPDTGSVALLNTSKVDGDERTIEWTTSGLKLKGVSIRI